MAGGAVDQAAEAASAADAWPDEEAEEEEESPRETPFWGVGWFRTDGREESARLQWDFVAWMAKFRAVALHYLERYVEWFNGLLHHEIVIWGT